MVCASDLAEGMVVRVEGQIYRVLKVESKAAAAKLGGVVKAELSNVTTGRLWEARFRPQERLEDLQVERRNMEFLFQDGDVCTFMDPNSFEQTEVACEILGPGVNFLQSGAVIALEFFSEQADQCCFTQYCRGSCPSHRSAFSFSAGQRVERGNAGQRDIHSRSFVHRARRASSGGSQDGSLH